MSDPYAPPDPSRPPNDAGTSHEPEDSEQQPGPGGSGGSSGSGGSGPERPKPTPEQMAGVSRSVLYFGLFMLAAVLTLQVPLPWQLVSIAFAVAAVVIGVRTLIRVFKQQVRGTIMVLLIVGLMLSGMLLVTSLSSVALWNEQMERQDCMSSAITVTAQDRCEQAYQEAIEDRFSLP